MKMMTMKKKVSFMTVALLMVRFVSSEMLAREDSPAPSPVDEQSSPPQMSPSESPSDSESEPPTMPNDYIYQSPSQSPEVSADLNHTDVTEGERSSSSGGGGGGKTAGIAVGMIAAASMVGFGGYVFKKRRENIRRSRYQYAATEIF